MYRIIPWEIVRHILGQLDKLDQICLESGFKIFLVHVRGFNIFQGYWDDEENTNKVLDKSGWYDTGDTGVLRLVSHRARPCV